VLVSLELHGQGVEEVEEGVFSKKIILPSFSKEPA